MKNIKTRIEHGKQKYIDEEINIRPPRLSAAIARLSGNDIKPLPTGKYDRKPLRWVKPDGRGGVIPV